MPRTVESGELSIPVVGAALEATLHVPSDATGAVVFAHGSGSSRFSPRNRFVSEQLLNAGLATLLVDLLTTQEEELDRETAHLRFDIPLLARRLVAITDWLQDGSGTQHLPLGYFGASTGAAAALMAAAERPEAVRAVVSRGGRPDLAGSALGRVTAPTLLIVGGEDPGVLGLNEAAMARMHQAEVVLRVVPGATHLFQEPGALQEVARLAGGWFAARLSAEARGPRGSVMQPG